MKKDGSKIFAYKLFWCFARFKYFCVDKYVYFCKHIFFGCLFILLMHSKSWIRIVLPSNKLIRQKNLRTTVERIAFITKVSKNSTKISLNPSSFYYIIRKQFILTIQTKGGSVEKELNWLKVRINNLKCKETYCSNFIFAHLHTLHFPDASNLFSWFIRRKNIGFFS